MSESDQDTQDQAQPGKFDINMVIDNAKSVITTPSNYFQNMPKSG